MNYAERNAGAGARQELNEIKGLSTDVPIISTPL
jgi:hypothetical protein